MSEALGKINRQMHFQALMRLFREDQERVRLGNHDLALGYIVIERQHGDDLLIVYPNKHVAEIAIEHDIYIDGLCEEDCLDCYVLSKNDAQLIISIEVDVILAEPFDPAPHRD